MMCEACNYPLNDDSIIEWLSNKDQSLAKSIRVVHRECEYSSFIDLIFQDLEDHWIPLENFRLFIEIALEMKWDYTDIAIEKFYYYLQYNKKREV